MANNLRFYRLKHGLNLHDLGEKVGCNHNNIIAQEHSRLTAKRALIYANALGENVFDILGEDVLVLLPKTQTEKDKILSIVSNIKVDGE